MKNVAIVVIFILVLLGVYLYWDKIKSFFKKDSMNTNNDYETIILDKMTLDKISLLHPLLRTDVKKIVSELSKEGINYRVYDSLRTNEQQAKEYGKGRTQNELLVSGIEQKYFKYANPSVPKVTNAKPTQSFHEYGLALDGVEIKNNVAIWKNPNQDKINNVFKKYGFKWGGSFSDTPHFEKTYNKTWQQLLDLVKQGKLKDGYVILT